MNNLQINAACKKFLDLDTLYCDPACQADYIRRNCEYDNQYKIAMTTLCQKESLRRRIIGDLVGDDWLTFERFKPIAKKCYDILFFFYDPKNENAEVYSLEEWQIKLMNWFLLCSQQ